jgi:putative glutamine amidotransferase
VPVLVPLGEDETAVRAVVSLAHGLLVTGGVDISPGVYGEATLPECGEIDPLRDLADRWALQEALSRGLPVFGICRGIQSLAAFLGGSLSQDIPGHRQTEARNVPTQDVAVEEGTLLARIVGAGAFPVNTFHHQAVRRVPSGFCVSARAADGTVEGLEAADGAFRLGVQWHPEDLAPKYAPHQALFDAFVEAARGGAA